VNDLFHFDDSTEAIIRYSEGRDVLKEALKSMEHSYDPIYKPKKRRVSIEADKCYFCGRTEKEWGAIHKKILDYLTKQKKDAIDSSGDRGAEIDSGFQAFTEIWSQVNKNLKVSTIISDPHEFLPDEISKYWPEDWDIGVIGFETRNSKPFSEYFGDYKMEEHPEWFSLERLCLEWLFKYHTDYHSAVGMRSKEEKKNKDVRVSKIEKKMFKKIKSRWQANLGNSREKGYGMTKENQISLERYLSQSLIKLQELKNGLMGFTWKPYSQDEIVESSGSNSNRSGSRSDLFSIHMKICPICHDRFQSQESEW
jgi:hypothetical protein